jgi:formylglycine-generating enzyme required for sulfatase activity
VSDKDKLEAELQGIQVALGELEIERSKGMIDFGRYLQLKKEFETRKAELKQELDNLARGQRILVATPPERPKRKAKPAKKKSPNPFATRQPFEPEMVLIPAGEFLMGSDPKKVQGANVVEQPQHILHLPDYYLARTPVTNTQYAAFVGASGHDRPKHWQGGKPPQGKDDHPVVNVSWHDAVAYCRWLSEATGRPYALPSEAQWEKGARGADGRIYPWGDQWDASRCNAGKGGKGDTTPVETYPQGASPYGLLDMAGNVWEWTTSVYKNYPYDPDDGRENLEAGDDVRRVLRGGAFYYLQRLAR